MSLAEDLPRSYIGSLSRHNAPQKLARISLAELAGKSAPEPSIGRKPSKDYPVRPAPEPIALAPAPEKESAPVVSMTRRTERPIEKESSLDILDRASKGMNFLLGRYKQLEDHVKQVDAWSQAQIQAAEAAAARWQESATAAEKRLEECQRTLDIMVRRAEAAEQSMHRDKESLTILQDRIVQAFGFGSEAHDALSGGMTPR